MNSKDLEVIYRFDEKLSPEESKARVNRAFQMIFNKIKKQEMERRLDEKIYLETAEK